MTLPAGARLGPYEVVSILGAGGMGEVYRARDPRLAREVAIKVLPAGALPSADQMLRFEQEAKAAGALNHPNIMAVLDTGVQDDRPYVVSELLEGETLRRRLEGGLLTPRKALDYAAQIARGLAAAHDKGIVHRDLKPENLFVTSDGIVKILDFGLAKRVKGPTSGDGTTGSLSAAAPETEPGTILGTIGYMSPEQVRGLVADARSDIFSFGAVFYEMLSGRRAFQKETAAEAMTAILKEDPPEVSRSRPDVPGPVERVVGRCMEKRPEERFQSARDVAFALEALSGISGGPKAPAVSVSRRRARRVALVGAVLLALVAAGVAGRRTAHERIPSFQALTFRRGMVGAARFAPDGRTIVYSAAWDGGPPEVYVTQPENPESKSLGLPPGHVIAVSTTGELLVQLTRDPSAPTARGTLARVPLSGGVPRELSEDVDSADWTPDGSRICIAHSVAGRYQLEFPIGTVLHRSARIQFPRISPRGDRVAFVGDEGIEVVDLTGRHTTLATEPPFSVGLSWSARGDEVWYSAGATGGERALYAVSLSGKRRLVCRIAGSMTVLDVSTAGRVLLSHGFARVGVMVHARGQAGERDVSIFDRSLPAALSADGRTLLIASYGTPEGISGGAAAYLRRADGSPPLRLGVGQPVALSPDGKWALCLFPKPARLVRIPTGAGELHPVELDGLEPSGAARWSSDGARLIVSANEKGHPPRLFVLEGSAGKPRPLTPEGVGDSFAISPDGRLVAVAGPRGGILLFPVEGGDPREIPKARGRPLQWTVDGQTLYVREVGDAPTAVVSRIEASSGHREPWKELLPSDPTGVGVVLYVQVTPDAQAYAYMYGRYLTDLYLVDGIE